jgi:hypothetical protein
MWGNSQVEPIDRTPASRDGARHLRSTRLTHTVDPNADLPPRAGTGGGVRRHRQRGQRPADLVFVPTFACREADPPGDGGPGGPCTACTDRHHSLSAPRPGWARRRAGLTPKPHHAQQPRVALRGSFRLRLASTCNHRPERSPSLILMGRPTAGRPPPRSRCPGLRPPRWVRRRWRSAPRPWPA